MGCHIGSASVGASCPEIPAVMCHARLYSLAGAAEAAVIKAALGKSSPCGRQMGCHWPCTWWQCHSVSDRAFLQYWIES